MRRLGSVRHVDSARLVSVFSAVPTLPLYPNHDPSQVRLCPWLSIKRSTTSSQDAEPRAPGDQVRRLGPLVFAAAVAVRAHLARVRERVGTACQQITLTRCEPPLPLSKTKWLMEERLCNLTLTPALTLTLANPHPNLNPNPTPNPSLGCGRRVLTASP